MYSKYKGGHPRRNPQVREVSLIGDNPVICDVHFLKAPFSLGPLI